MRTAVIAFLILFISLYSVAEVECIFEFIREYAQYIYNFVRHRLFSFSELQKLITSILETTSEYLTGPDYLSIQTLKPNSVDLDPNVVVFKDYSLSVPSRWYDLLPMLSRNVSFGIGLGFVAFIFVWHAPFALSLAVTYAVIMSFYSVATFIPIGAV